MGILICITALLTTAVSGCYWYQNRTNTKSTRVYQTFCVAAGLTAMVSGISFVPESYWAKNAAYVYISAAAILLDLILAEVRRLCLKKVTVRKAVPDIAAFAALMVVCITQI